MLSNIHFEHAEISIKYHVEESDLAALCSVLELRNIWSEAINAGVINIQMTFKTIWRMKECKVCEFISEQFKHI